MEIVVDPTPKQVTANRAEWCTALRSGNYVQGKKYLAIDSLIGEITYCCLGVAACIASKKELIGVNDLYTFPDVSDALEIDVAGTFKQDVTVDDMEYCSLAELNDSGKLNFKEIADIIEQNSDNFCLR